jgi:hypothetical protein
MADALSCFFYQLKFTKMRPAKPLQALLTLLTVTLLLAACKKEEREPPFNAAMLQQGRAAIKFTASKAFNGDKEFNISNTPSTLASNQPFSNSNARNLKLEAMELGETGTPTRKAIIDMAVSGNAPTTIDLARTNGLPLGKITLESYSIFGYFRHSTAGSISITRLTTTEIEGSFSASFDDGTVIGNGKFAGRF